LGHPLLTLNNLTLGFGGDELFKKLEISISAGDRIALVGRNGSGKSTLLKILSGLTEPDEGTRFLQPGISIAYLGQEIDFEPYNTAADYLKKILVRKNENIEYLIMAELLEIDISPTHKTINLSGGEKRRLGIAGTLIGTPDILLLDEPTNHLDINFIEWLETRLKKFSGAIIIISHDRLFLKSMSKSTLWLDRGALYRLDRGFEYFEKWSEEILSIELKKLRSLDKLIASETAWSREGISARRKRNQGRLRRLQTLRSDKTKNRKVEGIKKLETQPGKISGRLVAELKSVSKSFDDMIILNNVSTKVMRGDRIGIIGTNGCGKSTFLKILIGQISLDSGKIDLGTNLEVLFFDQARETLDPEKTLWETLCDSGGDHINVRGESKHIVGYLKDFLFHPNQIRSPIKSLSGGEKSRLILAKFLAKPSNLMILDEPTNDLDMETLDLLQEMLSDYDGTILLVSHDRDFLDRTISSILVFEGEGAVQAYAGGYSDYISQRHHLDFNRPIKKNLSRKSWQGGRYKFSKSNKLSYKDQRELNSTMAKISTIESDISGIEKKLKLAGKDIEKIEKLAKKLEVKSAELKFLEARWIELESLKEEINDVEV